jgi:hypothetical protein
MDLPSSGVWPYAVGPNAVIINAFAWLDPDTSFVSSSPEVAGAVLVFVPPPLDVRNIQRAYRLYPPYSVPLPPWFNDFFPLIDQSALPNFPPFPITVLRPGMPCTIATVGDFCTRFEFGGEAGSTVWADPATGLAYTSDGGGFWRTNFTLMQSGGAGASMLISSFSLPFQ